MQMQRQTTVGDGGNGGGRPSIDIEPPPWAVEAKGEARLEVRCVSFRCVALREPFEPALFVAYLLFIPNY